MTDRPAAQPKVPFSRILVPYDGSEQAETALTYGIALAQHGAALDLLNVVDETPVLTEASTSVVTFDPAPLIDALDAEGHTVLAAAEARCRAAGIDVYPTLLHEMTVAGIVDVAEKNGDQVIVLGTHGREGLQRTFLGSTTEAVLRSTHIPVLAVHADTPAPSPQLFSKILVGVDDSDPSDAAVALAALLVRALGASAVICSAFDEDDVLAKAGTYGYDPQPLLETMRSHALEIVERAIERGGFPPGTATPTVVNEDPTNAIIDAARDVGADVVVVGSHGRRGLRRLFLGSVAEHVVRHSRLPVLVVRAPGAG
jgi:nucleotide-binding universal stress UspA family protein